MWKGCFRQCLRSYTSSAHPASRSKNVLDELKQRGLVQAITSRSLKQHLDAPRAVYLGCDPSAASLHVGNLVAMIVLLHFQLQGHKALALIGGATGSVGDPSGRSTERSALSSEVLDRNIASITAQVTRLFERGVPLAAKKSGLQQSSQSNVEFFNNKEWIGKMSLLDFLSGPGKRARVSTMLSRESVKSRLQSEAGISFTEFSYQLLQAFDFYHLHKDKACTIQIGGSDQWGNIQAGIEMIRREALSDAELATDALTEGSSELSDTTQPAYGLTLPLLTTASGEKFGKSAGNAIWLDESLTSPFDLYQFFLRTPDADVKRYLKIFTFLPLEQLEDITSLHDANPEQRLAQKTLAREVTELVHGDLGVRKALAATEVLFGASDLTSIEADDILMAFDGPQVHQAAKKEILTKPLVDIVVTLGLTPSKSRARQALTGGGLYLNNSRITDAKRILEKQDLIGGRVAVFRVGRNSLKVVDLR